MNDFRKRIGRTVIKTVALLIAMAGLAVAQDSTSTLLQLLQMGTGLHSNDWGTQTNSNLAKVESAIAGYSTIASGGGGTVTLTNDQARFASFAVTGTLTGNSTIVFPSTAREFNIRNSTTGSFTVSVNCGGGTAVTLAQSQSYHLFCDGSNTYSATPSGDSIPVGTMMAYAGGSAPTNYNLCDGSTVSRTTYATLFAAVGTAYGAGDGVTTFNLPDARGRVLAGDDSTTGRLNNWGRGTNGGSATHAMSLAELVGHTHTITDPGHNHGVTDPGHNHTVGVSSAANMYPGNNGTANIGGSINTGTSSTGLTINSATTGITATNSTGTGTAFSVVQPTLVTNCIIRIQ